MTFDEGMNLGTPTCNIPLFNEIVENHIHHTGEINFFYGRRLRGPLRGQRDRAQLDPRRARTTPSTSAAAG